MQNYFSIALFYALCSIASHSFSQLQVTPNNNATQLAQTLVGPGVVISNITKNCPIDASGTFNGTASNIGINGGLLLTSGQVTDALGPNNSPSAGTDNFVNFADPDLTAIEPAATFDPCIIEFDAVPSCSTLSFTFVFGSDEYNEYVIGAPPPYGSVNDCFGIFVTGPNPAGPAYNGYDMALVPATTTIVTINTVNNGYSPGCPATGPCINCAYYTDNCNGTTVQYDGFTTPITATLNVIPCATYHFKLAIADAVDGVWDSGVFFLSQSLQCNPLPILVNTTSTPSACTANNGSATANPSGGTPPYTYLWNSAPPQNTQTATGLGPGNYTVTVIDATGCLSNTSTVTVAGVGGFAATSTQTDVTCFGNNDGSATVTPNGGNVPYAYSWSTNPVQITQTISNIPAGNYTCTITDATGCIQTVIVTITQPPAIGGSIISTVNVSCPAGNDGSATASGSGGSNPYNYSWNTTPVQAGATASNLAAGNYIVTITDASGCTTTQSVTITQPVAMNLPTSSTIASCGMSDGTATVTPSGGVAPYTYLWLTTPAVQITPTASNLTSGTYSVIVTDANGCLQNQSVVVPGGGPPVADFTFSPSVVSLLDPVVLFTDGSSGIVSLWNWNFGDINSGSNDSSNIQNPSHTFSDTGIYCITLTIASSVGVCADTIVKCLRVESPFTFYIPNTFTPNQDDKNEIFMGYGTYISQFNMYIFDRWGNLIFESKDMNIGWNGAVNNKGQIVQEDVYVWKVKLVDANNTDHTYIGHVNLVR